MYPITIPGPDGPITVLIDGDYYIVKYGRGTITTGGSPTFVDADPPIGPVDRTDLGEIYRQVIALLS